MKKWVILLFVVFVATAGWRIGGRLSADAVGMAVGIVFGVLASIPAALLVLAAGRRRDSYAGDNQPGRNRNMMARYSPQGGQPPVIVVTSPSMPVQQPGLPAYGGGHYGTAQDMATMPIQRQFKMVGEADEWVDEW